jgi:DNA-binding MarR family transcriptional regulator
VADANDGNEATRKIATAARSRQTRSPDARARAAEREQAAAGVYTTTIHRHWVEAVPHDRLAHLVKDATRALVRALQLRLAEHDVSFGHWTFLRILWESDGLTQKQLSDQAGVMEPTTFAAVTEMERRGYVTRSQRAGNRKQVHVKLTPRGRALKRRLVPLAEEVNRIGLQGIDPASVATTRQVLIGIIANLARHESQGRMPTD